MPHASARDSHESGFVTLEARIERVSDATIRKKWKKLPSSSHDAPRDAISVAKLQARARRGKGQHTRLVEECVEDMCNRLIDRLPRIPYPPTTDASHFDHEANLNRSNKLETQLAENTHSMQLLRAQIKKEEKLLAQDEEELQMLEKGAAHQEAISRQRKPHLHSLAKDIGLNKSDDDFLTLAQQDTRVTKSAITLLCDDEELRSTLNQLGNHLDSMTQNIAYIDAVSQGIVEARYELCAVSANLSSVGK